MNRITKKFKELQKSGKIAFMPFVVAGDPDFETSLSVVQELVQSADCLEIGIPYSDPLADGPTIQAADQRALASGMDTDKAFEFVKEIRKFSDIPITFLVYANLVYQRGVEKFYKDAKEAGVDGILIPDLPVEESEEYVFAAKGVGIHPIFLVAQTTNSQRLEKILEQANGYLYLVAVLGVTGERSNIDPATISLIEKVKQATRLPVVVGFGISNRDQIQILKKAGVDGYIIGSALVKIIANISENKNEGLKEISKYIKQLT